MRRIRRIYEVSFGDKAALQNFFLESFILPVADIETDVQRVKHILRVKNPWLQ